MSKLDGIKVKLDAGTCHITPKEVSRRLQSNKVADIWSAKTTHNLYSRHLQMF